MIKNVGIIGRGALGIMYAKAFIEALGFDNVFIIVDEIFFTIMSLFL
ncbi:MAG: hypothetical protein Q4E81_06685 [Succinatimonas sp.]|nr:hypothetical protein [Succinatimonas sp.]